MKQACIELYDGKKINIKLLEENAPLTVANFIHLIKTEFYNDTVFHRIIPGFMSQGGAYIIESDQIAEKITGYTIPGEFNSNGWFNNLSHTEGVLSMARTGDPNSASSQFFICGPGCAHLDSQYAAFGLVADEESLQVIRELNQITTTNLGGAFTDFPTGEAESFTIKTIKLLN